MRIQTCCLAAGKLKANAEQRHTDGGRRLQAAPRVLVVVAGVTFVAINTGLRLEARERFLVTLLVGGLLALPWHCWLRLSAALAVPAWQLGAAAFCPGL